MTKHEIVLIVVSVLGSAIAFGLPLVTLLWKAFGLIASIRLELAQLGNANAMVVRDLQDVEEKWQAVNAQTLQRFDHFSTRLKGDVKSLELQVREIQGYLTKTTSFEVRDR